MVNIDKEKLNQNINDAYNNQTEGVKELLESAKKNLVDQKSCTSDYTINKNKANNIYKINRIVTKSKESENQLEKRINDNFQKMNEKLEINSKNLDFIFKTVAYNNDTIKDGVKDVLVKYSDVKNQETRKQIISQQKNIAQNLAKLQIEAERKILQKQIEAQNKLLNSQKEANNRLETNIKLEQDNLKREVIKLQQKIEKNNNVQQILVQTPVSNSSKSSNNVNAAILNVESQLESKIDNMQKQNAQTLLELKQEMIKAYKEQNKKDLDNLLEERKKFLQELQEKDIQIRKLNYRLYEYEEKLEREMQKNQKSSLFSFLFKKEETIEEQPAYTSQILNYMY